MTEVVAAMIQDGNGRILVCRRPLQKTRGGLWEFVGGKLEPGETEEDALIRECREELGVTVLPKSIFYKVTYRYPDIEILLTLYRADIVEGTPQLLEHMELRWVDLDALSSLAFCPADEEILRVIADYRAKGLL